MNSATIQSRMLTTLGVAFGALLLASTALADYVNYDYETEVSFDPHQAVGAQGEKAKTLVDEIFGPGVGSSGHATVTGSFSYKSNTSAFGSDADSSVYSTALTGAKAHLNGNTVEANIAAIRDHKPSSRFGTSNTGSCATIRSCDQVGGERFNPTGTLIQLLDATPMTFLNADQGDDANFTARDALNFALGDTDTNGGFSGALSTPTFGDVYVDEIVLDLISKPFPDFFGSTALPGDLSFLDEIDLGASYFFLEFTGAHLPRNFLLRGQLANVEPGEGGMSVPAPATSLLLLTSLLSLAFLRPRH